MRRRTAWGVALVALLIGLAGGCRRGGSPGASAERLVVPVSHPVVRSVTEYVEYTGRTDSVESVGIRARVTGYLVRAPFREGAEVKKGDLLFEIDPRPYKAQLDQAESQVRVAEAQAGLARANYARVKDVGTAVSPQERDQLKAAAEAADAQVAAAKAT